MKKAKLLQARINAKNRNRGVQLKFARNWRGYSQTELAKKIKGVSQNDISKFENGKPSKIDENKIQEIMSLLNFPLRFLEKRIRIWNCSNY